MKPLVYIEARDGVLSQDSLGVLARAAQLGEAAAVLCGEGLGEFAAEVAARGAARVHLIESAAVAEPLPQPHVEAVAALVVAERYSEVLFSTSILATDIAGGLSAALEAGVNWDLVDIDADAAGEPVGRRLALGDGVQVMVGWRGAVRIATFRPGSFDPAESGAAGEVVGFAAHVSDRARRTTRESLGDDRGGGSSLGDAEIIVAGGRGLGEPEKLQMVRELAEALGGVPGVSMPLVSEGWAPYSMQVGQTGTVVRPRLYVACGISGQMQHKIGMERSGTIVAINIDEQAPIFRFCDLAVVADLNVVVPALTALVRERSGSSVTR
jgi:electron transfer flavoprotein alpha subunit